MADISKTKAFLLAAMAMLFTFTTSAFAQGMDTAYVPFNVNVNATATAQLAGGGKFEKSVRAGYTDTLLIVTEGNTPLARQGKTPNPVTMYSSRGKISLELSRQLYRSTDIALYSLNGKQILHGKAVASEAVKSISHPNVAMGVYLLSVKGVNGGIFTTRLAHSGGGLNIDVAFANGNYGALLGKEISGNWTITVSAGGYLDTSYAFAPETGRGNTGVQEITLRQTLLPSSSSEFVSSSSSEFVSSSSSEVVVLSSSSEVFPSSSSEAEPSSSSSSESGNDPSSSSAPPEEGYPPNPPSLVIATVNSVNSITINWLSVSNASDYYIYRSMTVADAYAPIGFSATTSYADNSLLSGTTYYYKVAAYNNYGEGAQSSYASATTPPSAPAGVTAAVNSESSITVGWGSVTGATGYYIYRSESYNGTYSEIGTSETASYADTDLLSSTAYYYKIAAYNSGGTGTQSGYAYAYTPPSVPTGVTATANSTSSITVNWLPVTGASTYYIYCSTIADGTYTLAGTSATTSYTNTSLSIGTTYYYKIAAYNSGGTGTQSSYASIATLPGVPTNVTATANSESSITVGWGSVTGVTGYYIYRSESASSTYTQVGTSETTSYADTDLLSGTAYYYKIAAYNSGGTGTQSGYASAATITAPTGITAEANSGSSIFVWWSSVTGASTYYIYRSTSADGTYTQIGTSATTSYTSTGLPSGTTYYYKVAAYNGSVGVLSGYASATTMLIAPTGVKTMANSESSIIVDWGSVTGAAGYYIYRSESASGTYTQVGTSETTSYANTDLSSGTAYYYKVAAYNSIETGPQSSYASVATFLPAVSTCVADSTVTIGPQTWMKGNLNCDVSNSKCYGNDEANCDKYGRLYSWATAMNLPGSCNSISCPVQLPHKGICPSGWHLPSTAEWEVMTAYIGGASTEGKKLKATSGWLNNGNGTDDYGFSALPGGFGLSNGSFDYVGNYGGWWSASEFDSDGAYTRGMFYYYEYTSWGSSVKSYLYSVRCLQD